MKVYRYMSRKEFDAVWNGEELINDMDHGARRAKTNSVGFCFLGEEGDGNPYSPIDSYQFLSGIVSDDILVEFEVLDESSLTESWGVYADPCWNHWDDTIIVKEYCTTRYSSETLKPLRYTPDVGFDICEKDVHWYDFH